MATPANILIVEDDENLRLTLVDILEGEDYRVKSAATLIDAEAIVLDQDFQLVILDLMLPDGDGYSFCKKLRESGHQMPILMLTARSLEDDLVKGFDMGADDYLVKPYRVNELLARVRALLKRESGKLKGVGAFKVNGYDINRSARTIKNGGSGIEMTPKEFDVFLYLWDNPHRAISRDHLLEEVWGKVVVDPRTVDNFISSIKKKLGLSIGNAAYIETVRGVGYRLER
jgi:DNA-binding response OmpR family regulator